MTETSSSQLIWDVLEEQSIGYMFTVHTLTELLQSKGLKLTPGSISGFITRAHKKERIDVVGLTQKFKGHPSVRQYELIDLTPWKFTKATKGSVAGRHVVANNEPKPNLVEVASATSMVYNFLKPAIPTQVKIPLDTSMSVSKETMEEFHTATKPTLAQQLMELAIQVEQLEHVTIKEYSTQELLDELATRVK